MQLVMYIINTLYKSDFAFFFLSALKDYTDEKSNTTDVVLM